MLKKTCVSASMVLLMLSSLGFGYTMSEGPAPTIDGNLSDWAGAEWINMDQVWSNNGTDPFDLSQAKCAVRWSSATNQIYVAATGVDVDHHFFPAVDATTVPPTWPEWDGAEQVEIYFDAGNSNNTAYSYDMGWYQTAQQFVGGRTVSGEDFIAIGGPSAIMEADKKGIVPGFKTSLEGDVISYEIALTPYQFLNIQPGYDLSGLASSTILTLQPGMVVGLDIIMSSVSNDDMGQRYWWDGSGEWCDASAFPDFTLVPEPVSLLMIACGGLFAGLRRRA
jgi:hypothetical protein